MHEYCIQCSLEVKNPSPQTFLASAIFSLKEYYKNTQRHIWEC
jgi:hypothetical protein